MDRRLFLKTVPVFAALAGVETSLAAESGSATAP